VPESSPFPKSEILIVGAGVLGLCTAVELTRRGHAVTVLDPGGANASSVAAGMIAPALEAAIDDATPERGALLRAARVLWTGFAQATGVSLKPGPAVWRGEGGDEIAARLSALGFAVERLGEDVLTTDDVQVEPEAAMARLIAGLRMPPLVGAALSVSREDGRWRVVTDAGVLEADKVVLATGAAKALPGLPGTVARLMGAVTPIRGQIGRTDVALADGVVRGQGAYLAPAGSGGLIGATMEPGRTDLAPDPEAGRVLLEAASRVMGRDLTGIAADWRVGVRGTTPDGLPMAGATGEPGLFLALAPRRNGWLLGPLVGQAVADGIEGRAMADHAGALDPRRFLSPSR